MYVTSSPARSTVSHPSVQNKTWLRTDLQSGNELRQCDKQEVEVEEELELLVEDEREEREHVVLLVAHDVRGEPPLELLCVEQYQVCSA